MMAGLAAISGIVGTGMQLYSSFTQASAQKKAMKAQERARQLASMRERRNLIRQRQVAMAQAQQGGVNAGAAGSSALAGVMGSLGSQGLSDVADNQRYDQLGNRTYRANKDYMNAGTWGILGQAVASIGPAASSWAAQPIVADAMPRAYA